MLRGLALGHTRACFGVRAAGGRAVVQLPQLRNFSNTPRACGAPESAVESVATRCAAGDSPPSTAPLVREHRRAPKLTAIPLHNGTFKRFRFASATNTTRPG